MSHTCHWPDCGKEVPPRLWGCKKHWFMLPPRLRALIWKTYVPGQEITKTPSFDYRMAAVEVQTWILRNHSGPVGKLIAGRLDAVEDEFKAKVAPMLDKIFSEGTQSAKPFPGLKSIID